MHRLSALLTLLLALSLLPACQTSRTAGSSAAYREAASEVRPAVPGMTVDGKGQDLPSIMPEDGDVAALLAREHRGRIVMMTVMSFTCYYCVKQIPEAKKFVAESRGRAVWIPLISGGNTVYGFPMVQRNIKKHDLVYEEKYFFTGDVALHLPMRSEATPYNFIFDGNGKILYEGPGMLGAEELRRKAKLGR